MPVCHSTDSYGKHRQQREKFYISQCPEFCTHVESVTPKGDAIRLVGQESRSPTAITGDPVHDVIGMRRCVPAYANDAQDFIADYSDGIARLSGHLKPAEDLVPEELANPGRTLLQCGVRQHVQAFATALHEDEAGSIALKRFLSQPNVCNADTWKHEFGAKPPRGVVARLARRCDVTLHSSVGFQNYHSMREFKKEMRRVRKWYKKGKKESRRRTGILRNLEQSSRILGRRTVMTKKLSAHFKRLEKPLRLEGLWNWQEIALALRIAGIPVQTGTVAVERYWSSMKSMLPQGAQRISPEWFEIVSMIAFLRHNYKHFSADSLPSWCRRDSLLAQRIESFGACAQASQETDSVHLAEIFKPFLVEGEQTLVA